MSYPSQPEQQQAQQAPPSYGREDVLMEQFRAIAARYEINDQFAAKLKQLEGFEIVLILDDSGSMNTPLADQGANASPFAKSVTRWDELKQTAGIIVDIGHPSPRSCSKLQHAFCIAALTTRLNFGSLARCVMRVLLR